MLSVISVNEANKWDSLVKSFRHYDVYYLSSYTKAFQLHGDGEPFLFYFEGEGIRSINVVMKRDIGSDERFNSELPQGKYYDLATPYGYGGFLIEGKPTEFNIKCLDKEYSTFCRQQGIVTEFCRFHPVLENAKALESMYDISWLGKTIVMNLDSRERIWNNLTSKNRNMVRKAQKAGVEIFWGRSPHLFKEFTPMYNATMDRNNGRDYYYFGDDFYTSVLCDLKYNALIFYAVYLGKPVAMSMVLFANQMMSYHLSASDRQFQSLAPTNLLLYEAACWGCENGYKSFHLGGGLGSKEDSLYRFKSCFNRDSNIQFAVGRKIFDEEAYMQLVKMRAPGLQLDKREDDTGFPKQASVSFFPQYRAEAIVSKKDLNCIS